MKRMVSGWKQKWAVEMIWWSMGISVVILMSAFMFMAFSTIPARMAP